MNNYFTQQREIHHHGDGLITNLLSKRPKPIRDFLIKRGRIQITDMKVCRKPVAGIIQKLSNVLTFGQYNKIKKSLNYDDVFHLYLVLTLKNGEVYTIEKNQRVEVSKGFRHSQDCKMVELKLSGNIGLFNSNGLILRAEQNNLEYRYSAHKYNCQDFVMKILESSNLLTPELKEFILQDADKLMPAGFLRTLAQKATDTAGTVDMVLKGGGLQI